VLSHSGSGTTTINGGIAATTSLSISGAATLNGGSITTTGSQTYGGAVSLGANTTVVSTEAPHFLFRDSERQQSKPIDRFGGNASLVSASALTSLTKAAAAR